MPRLPVEVLVLYAMLIGGDYSDPLPFQYGHSLSWQGLPRESKPRRRALALRLAKDRPFADELVRPMDDIHSFPAVVRLHTKRWRQNFAKHVALPAYESFLPAGIPDAFPDNDALLLYAYPLVSDMSGCETRLPNWRMRPDVPALRLESHRLLQWTGDTFGRRIAPALANKFGPQARPALSGQRLVQSSRGRAGRRGTHRARADENIDPSLSGHGSRAWYGA